LSADRVETTAAAGDRFIDAVRGLDVPKQLVWGSDDPILPPGRAGERTRELAGGVPLHVVRARHFLQEEQPAAIAEYVAQLAAGA
jgi:pimeloyl-ACP methyl ester carboxylesterase